METNSDSKPSSPFPSLLHNQLKGYLDAFESKLIGIGLVSKQIQENIMENVSQEFEEEVREKPVPEKQVSRNRFPFKRIKTLLILLLFLMTVIRHCLTISWYLVRHQEDRMSITMKLMSSGNLYTFFGSLVCILISVCFSSSGYFVFVQLLIFVSSEKKDLLHSLYIFFPSKNVSQEKLKLSDKNMSFITKTFKYSVRLQGMANYLVVIPCTVMLLTSSFLSSYQDSNSFGLNFYFEILLSLPNMIIDQFLVYYATHQIFGGQIFLFVNSFYLILRIKQLIHDRISFNENKTLFYSTKQLNHEINQVYDMVLKRNLMVKHLIKNAVLICSPFVGTIFLFCIIDCPVWFKLVVFFSAISFLSLNVFSLYFLGQISHTSTRLYHSLHTLQVSLTSQKQVSSRQRLVSLKSNLNLMKMISSQRKPFGFTFPDEQLVTPLTAFSFLGSTVSFTLMVFGNEMFWSLFKLN